MPSFERWCDFVSGYLIGYCGRSLANRRRALSELRERFAA